MRIALWVSIVMLADASMSPGVSAHHSATASYEAARSIEIAGTVLEFSWKNPHCRISVNVSDGPFKGRAYTVEMSSPVVLTEEGWTRTTLHVGDSVVLHVHPSRAGAAVGLCRSCSLSINGKAIKPQVLQN